MAHFIFQRREKITGVLHQLVLLKCRVNADEIPQLLDFQKSLRNNTFFRTTKNASVRIKNLRSTVFNVITMTHSHSHDTIH
jgi:hypothetical protein